MRVVIFGRNDYAQLAHYYLSQDSVHTPVAFVVHEEYKTVGEFCKCPVIAFEELKEKYPPGEFAAFAPMSPKHMNNLRRAVYHELKGSGYELITYISRRATVLTGDIGENNFILENNVIQPYVKIGNNNVFWSGNHIGHHSVIGDHNTFTSHVVLSGHCEVKDNCFFGVNATIRDGLKIEQYSMVGQAANVTKDTEQQMVYVGNPAKKLEGKFSIEMI